MKIFFISPFCLLRPTTNRIFDVRFCDLLASADAEVMLVHPYYYMKENLDEPEIKRCYGITRSVKFKMLKTPLNNDSPKWWQLTVLMIAFFFLSIKIIYNNRKDLKNVYIISRDNKSAFTMMLLKKILGKNCPLKIVNTVHEVKGGKLNNWMYRNYDGIFVTTATAKEKLIKQYSISEKKIERLVSPVSEINYSCSKEEARKKIQYNDSKPLVVYTGKLGKGIKELDFIIDAASSLPQYNFILTGGKEEIVNHFKTIFENRKIQNIILPGFMNDATFISYYQLAADVLVSYYTKQDHVVEYNFPQKLIEYMYTRNPIVTPDFPATHDLINSSNSIIVEPDNLSSLVEGIKKAIEDKASSKELAEKAFRDIQPYSFENRGKQLKQFLLTL